MSPAAQGAEPGARAARLLRELAAEMGVELPAAGTCMAPVVVAGERVRLERARCYWPGDLIAYRAENGRLLLHRVIGWRPTARGWRLLTQADNAARPDGALDPRHVIGRLVERDGHRVVVPLGDRLRAGGRLLRFVLTRALRTRAAAGCARAARPGT